MMSDHVATCYVASQHLGRSTFRLYFLILFCLSWSLFIFLYLLRLELIFTNVFMPGRSIKYVFKICKFRFLVLHPLMRLVLLFIKIFKFFYNLCGYNSSCLKTIVIVQNVDSCVPKLIQIKIKYYLVVKTIIMIYFNSSLWRCGLSGDENTLHAGQLEVNRSLYLKERFSRIFS